MNDAHVAQTWPLLSRLTLSVLYRHLVLLYCRLCCSGKGCCGGTVPMMHQVAWNHTKKKKTQNTYKTCKKNLCLHSYTIRDCVLLLKHSLPFSESLSDGEAGDHSVDLGPPFAHVVFNVEHKRLLSKVSIYNLTWCLKAHGGIQVGLEDNQMINFCNAAI